MNKVKVVGRTKDDDGNIIGKYDGKPILNTMLYDVEFPDCFIRKHKENLIAEKNIPKLILRVFRTPYYLESMTFPKIPLLSKKASNIS